MTCFQGWYEHRDWQSGLRNLYWQLRGCRRFDQAKRRKLYRAIFRERARLQVLGFDREYTRLYCRFMSDPRNEFACARLRSYEGMLDLVKGVSSASAWYVKNLPEFDDLQRRFLFSIAA